MKVRINDHLDRIETLIQTRMPGSRYQFELLDLATSQDYGRGLRQKLMPWGSVYKLFVIAAVVQMLDEGLLAPDQVLYLDTLIRRLMAVPHQWAADDYMYSPEMLANYEAAIAEVLPENDTHWLNLGLMWRPAAD